MIHGGCLLLLTVLSPLILPWAWLSLLVIEQTCEEVQLFGDLLVITPEPGLDVVGADRWGRPEGGHHRNGAMLVPPAAGSAAGNLERGTIKRDVSRVCR